MSKLKAKFLEQYSFSTLRDAALSSLANGDFIVYNSTTQKWENKKQPRFGTDFFEVTNSVPALTTGVSWNSYATLNFSVSGPDLLNKYRFFMSFLWQHDSIANGAQFRLVVDGVQQGDILQIEPQDSGLDQRLDGSLLRYVSNLTIGNHTAEIQFRPFNSTRITTIFQATLETWRVQ